VVPNHEVIRSSRIGDAMARDSPGERRSAKPPVGFNSRRVSQRPVVQWTGRLPPTEQARVRIAPGRPVVLTLAAT
jgi:hypothetical protein